MTRSWARSGRPRSSSGGSSRGARPAGSWWASVQRARESWDALRSDGYSEAAAAAILAAALGLWSDTARAMGELGADDPPQDGQGGP